MKSDATAANRPRTIVAAEIAREALKPVIPAIYDWGEQYRPAELHA